MDFITILSIYPPLQGEGDRLAEAGGGGVSAFERAAGQAVQSHAPAAFRPGGARHLPLQGRI